MAKISPLRESHLSPPVPQRPGVGANDFPKWRYWQHILRLRHLYESTPRNCTAELAHLPLKAGAGSLAQHAEHLHTLQLSLKLLIVLVPLVVVLAFASHETIWPSLLFIGLAVLVVQFCRVRLMHSMAKAKLWLERAPLVLTRAVWGERLRDPPHSSVLVVFSLAPARRFDVLYLRRITDILERDARRAERVVFQDRRLAAVGAAVQAFHPQATASRSSQLWLQIPAVLGADDATFVASVDFARDLSYSLKSEYLVCLIDEGRQMLTHIP